MGASGHLQALLDLEWHPSFGPVVHIALERLNHLVGGVERTVRAASADIFQSFINPPVDEALGRERDLALLEPCV